MKKKSLAKTVVGHLKKDIKDQKSGIKADKELMYKAKKKK